MLKISPVGQIVNFGNDFTVAGECEEYINFRRARFHRIMRQTICRNRNTSNIQIPDSPCLTYKKNRVIQKENILASQFSTVGYVD